MIRVWYESFPKAIRYPLAAAVVLLSLYYMAEMLIRGVNALSLSEVSISYGPLLAFFGLCILCLLVGAVQWSILLNGFGVSMPLRRAVKVHLLSILPKYAPGIGWQIVGKAYLSNQAGVRSSVASFAALSELAVAMLAAVPVALLALPHVAFPAVSPTVALLLDLPLPLIALLYMALAPIVLQRVLGDWLAQRVTGTELVLSYARMLIMILAGMSTWTVFGLGCFILAASLYPVSIIHVPAFVFASTTAWIVGLLAFFAPVGLGIREVTMTFLLSFWLPGPYAALVALLSRVVLVLAELVAAALATRL